jgi:hypothetical protein
MAYAMVTAENRREDGDLPLWRVPRVAPGGLAWDGLPECRLVRSEDGAVPVQPTRVRLAWDERALHVRFDCADRDAWGTLTRRDDPLYQEEVVEVFVAPGEDDPRAYAELEVSPHGVLFDAWIENPDSDRATLQAHLGWDCPGVSWRAGSGGAQQDWWAELTLPWDSLLAAAGRPPAPLPRRWRANFYRIDRPRDGTPPEFSAWSPTQASPPDFHRPGRFGILQLVE